MSEKNRENNRKMLAFMRKKMKAQNSAYSAIFDLNAGEINYAKCQQIVFDCFQQITGVVLREFLDK